MSLKELCFFATKYDGEVSIIDTVIMVNGEYVSSIYKKTLADVRAEYHGSAIEVMELDAAYTLYEAAQIAKYCKPPKEVTEERFWDMLEVLPPVSWVRFAGEETFKLSERTIGNITLICARIGQKYYEYQGDIRTDHNDIIKHIQAEIAAGKVTKA